MKTNKIGQRANGTFAFTAVNTALNIIYFGAVQNGSTPLLLQCRCYERRQVAVTGHQVRTAMSTAASVSVGT
jgi:hypothetical protein